MACSASTALDESTNIDTVIAAVIVRLQDTLSADLLDDAGKMFNEASDDEPYQGGSLFEEPRT